MKSTLRYFTVMGSGECPYDMLRFDECWPVRAEDAARIHYYPGERRHREITMASYANYAPTVARWSSFTWACTEARDTIHVLDHV